MKNSYRYFENRECKYFPCHTGMETLNCLFCYCPLYPMEKCPGNYSFIGVGEKQIKECKDCTFPHQPENYNTIIQLLVAQK